MNTGSYKIDEYLKELASKSPVPGGGGASAVAGALSAALSRKAMLQWKMM